MSPGDDDISAALPRPPLPAPARREAAIAAAMRRFDGVGEAEPAAGRPVPSASWARRPSMGALAGAALVALIAVPLAWTSLDDQPYRDSGKPVSTGTPRPTGAPAVPTVAPSPEGSRSARTDEVLPARPAAGPDQAPVAAPTDAAKAAEEPAPVVAPSPPPPPPAEFAPPPAPPPEPVAGEAEALRDRAGTDQLVVTGTRIPRPNLESAAPVTIVDSKPAAAARRAATARSSRRGDWNACTVEDPARSLDGCRLPGAAADGLERAWKGDWEGAGRAFDSAIAESPRSSAAFLNRGLVRRRAGELERALADLDRAVRFSPRSARYYYHRSRVLRQLGDSARARADEARAVELDPRYASVARKRDAD
jgi:hypothetical protein